MCVHATQRRVRLNGFQLYHFQMLLGVYSLSGNTTLIATMICYHGWWPQRQQWVRKRWRDTHRSDRGVIKNPLPTIGGCPVASHREAPDAGSSA